MGNLIRQAFYLRLYKSIKKRINGGFPVFLPFIDLCLNYYGFAFHLITRLTLHWLNAGYLTSSLKRSAVTNHHHPCLLESSYSTIHLTPDADLDQKISQLPYSVLSSVKSACSTPVKVKLGQSLELLRSK